MAMELVYLLECFQKFLRVILCFTDASALDL